MLNNLNEKNLLIIEKIKKEAEKQGIRAFIVGGAVRDFFLKKEIKDIDFLIEGSAIQFSQNAGFEINSIHKDFNTVKAQIENIEVDIASTRVEKYPVAGSLPVVEKTGVNINDDLKRRDFTINSIAMNISTGEIIDPFNGENDIKQGVLKILHDKSFIDDPTRILRGLDFKYRFNFDFCPETKKLMLDCTKNYNREGLSIDRIYLTLNKIFKNEKTDKILSDILKNDIYKIWMNKTELNINDVTSLNEAAKAFNIKEKNNLFIMALDSCFYVKAPLKNDFEIFEFFKQFNSNQLALYYFKTNDKNALKYLQIKDIKPLISGRDLIKEGFETGKIIGDILSAIQKEKVLNPDKFKTKQDELNFAKAHKA